MRCMNCGKSVGNLKICPGCGCNLNVQRKAIQLSVRYYNQGLDKAQIRDLSGAIELLQRSLEYNKRNIDARNLLGLVYYETGEIVSALCEWIISKNIKPEENIASEYISGLQAEQGRLDIMNQTIRKYNIALQCCREGHDDVAAVQLKKILSQNTKLIKAYHLLALIYIHREEYEKARKLLRKAARIDRTNSTTLRFLKEIDEQTGTVTKLDEKKRWPWRSSRESSAENAIVITEDSSVIQPLSFRESSAFSVILNMLIGVLIGVLAVWFLIVPVVTQGVRRDAENDIIKYSNTITSQEYRIGKLEEELAKTQEQAEGYSRTADESGALAASYEDLLHAAALWQEGKYEEARALLGTISTARLPDDAKALYRAVSEDVTAKMLQQYTEKGIDAYTLGLYPDAVQAFDKALEISPNDYTALLYLAYTYYLNGESGSSVTILQRIADTYPDSQRSEAALNRISLLQSGAVLPSDSFSVTAQLTSELQLSGTPVTPPADSQDTGAAGTDQNAGAAGPDQNAGAAGTGQGEAPGAVPGQTAP